MHETTSERAINALHDYIIYRLDKGDPIWVKARKKVWTAKHERFKTKMEMGFAETKVSQSMIREVDRWLARKEASWKKAGRWHDAGYLKVEPMKPESYSFHRIQMTWPELGFWDCVALLVHIDGTMEGMSMDAKDSVREVIREMVGLDVARIFSGLLVELRRGAPEVEEEEVAPKALTKKSKRRACGICATPGHRRESCPKAKATSEASNG